MSLKRKLVTFTIAEKVNIISEVTKSGKQKNKIAKQFNIPPSTLSTILKNKDDILQKYETNKESMKIMKICEYPDIEVSLLNWLIQYRDLNIPINGPILKEKAELFAIKPDHKQFKASQGWLSNWKIRNNVVFRKICGENASVDQSICSDWLRRELCGGENSKKRVTILLGSNMTGTDKIKPLLIGKSAKPRCFKGIKTYPLDYESNKKAWMTRKKVLFLIVNCTAHNAEKKFNSIKVEFLPPNKTSQLQSMDQGIIQNFKILYRKEVIRKIVNDIDEGRSFSINLLQTMRMCYKAWENVKKNTIVNCFIKSGISTKEKEIKYTHLESDDGGSDWKLIVDHYKLKPEITFHTFTEIDTKIHTTRVLTDQDIVDAVQPTTKSDSDEDEEDEYPLVVSTKEAKASLDKLRVGIH
ncbi:tigger transposable element-derived protein 4-like [Myzus persicae]|uniref:tigger transposable element-derived protein 4-like n=1 Tax=Myzus persicae TaxID=13164 RepID=UPI000B9334D8|nr:tigger transposable element-derived protein 4-like [Myzus persicae]